MKYKKEAGLFVKILIIAASYFFIIYKIIQNPAFFSYLNHFSPLSLQKTVIILSVTGLMLLNWSLESVKWRVLVNRIEKISFLQSIQAVFSGITWAIFTPNRVGELGGRVFIFKPAQRIQAVFSTWIGSFSQLLVTLLAGFLGLGLFVLYYPHIFKQWQNYFFIVAVIAFISLIITLFVYFKINIFQKYLLKIRVLKKYQEKVAILSSYQPLELLQVLALSMLRYCVFIFQYYLMLFFFDVYIAFFPALLSIVFVFFITTLAPVITLAELGIRGSIAIFIMSFFSGNQAGILAASVALWLINLAVPAIIGSVFFSRTKI
jgi:hypothetical protein